MSIWEGSPDCLPNVPALQRRRSVSDNKRCDQDASHLSAEPHSPRLLLLFSQCRLGIDRTLRPYAVKPVLRLRLLTAARRVQAQARLHLQTFLFHSLNPMAKARTSNEIMVHT